MKDAPNSEIYNPSTGIWTSAGSTVVDLHSPNSGCLSYGGPHCYHPPGEVGPGILRPDGTVFATGSLATGATAGHTSVYSPVEVYNATGTYNPAGLRPSPPSPGPSPTE